MDFNTWFQTFLEEKEIDLGQMANQKYQVGDVVQLIYMAPSHEQSSIKNQLVKIDFHNGDVYDFFSHLSQAITPERKEEIDRMHMN